MVTAIDGAARMEIPKPDWMKVSEDHGIVSRWRHTLGKKFIDWVPVLTLYNNSERLFGRQHGIPDGNITALWWRWLSYSRYCPFSCDFQPRPFRDSIWVYTHGHGANGVSRVEITFGVHSYIEIPPYTILHVVQSQLTAQLEFCLQRRPLPSEMLRTRFPLPR
jgi:hypothetical protein